MKLTDEERARIAATGYLPSTGWCDICQTALDATGRCPKCSSPKTVSVGYIERWRESINDNRSRGLPEHRSDCAVHNHPAFDNGPCDCNYDNPSGRHPASYQIGEPPAMTQRDYAIKRLAAIHVADEFFPREGEGPLTPLVPHESQVDREWRELAEAVGLVKEEVLKAAPFKWVRRLMEWIAKDRSNPAVTLDVTHKSPPDEESPTPPPPGYRPWSGQARYIDKVLRFGERYGSPSHLVGRAEDESTSIKVIFMPQKLHDEEFPDTCSSCHNLMGPDDYFLTVPAATLYEASFLRALHNAGVHVQVRS